MGKIELGLSVKPPFCPLCLERMRRTTKMVGTELFSAFVCDTDRIGLKTTDPYVGHWEQAHEKTGKIPCPMCNADMRYFCTSTGYMKAKCPKKSCGATVHTEEPDRRDKGQGANPYKPGDGMVH